MRWLSITLSVGLFLGLSNIATACANKKTKHHMVRGTVAEVLRDDANKNTGILKVRVHNHRHKKNAVVGVAKTRKHSHIVTLHVHNKTKFEKVTQQKGAPTQH